MPETLDYCDVGLTRDGATAVVSVTGEVDLFAAPTLAQKLQQAAAGGAPIVIDLSACTFCDSSGLYTLLSAHLEACDRGRDVVVACLPDSAPARLLQLAAPGTFAEHHSRQDALAAVAA